VITWVPRLILLGGLCSMLAIAIIGPLRAGEIKGLVIDEAGRARISHGMQAEQTSKHTARIFGGGQGETGSVACVCKGTGAGCSLEIIHQRIFCKNTGCSDCKIEVKPTKPIKIQ
jgi:hypothetical protein